MTAIEHEWATASDAELITAVRSGESAPYGELYERHAGAARVVARQYTSSTADADDVVSDAFAKVLSVLQNGGGPDVAFRAYLFTVVRNTSYSLGAAGRRTRPTDDLADLEAALGHDASTEEPALADFERSVVARAYRGLPERWRDVLWYTEVEGMTPAQIAPLLGLTANGVAALAYRAREGLRQGYLQEHLTSSPAAECRRVNGLLGSYVRGGLAKRETAQVETHVEDCDDCRALIVELGDVSQGMRGIIAPLVLGLGALGIVGTALPVGGGAGAAAAGLSATGGAATGGAATGGAATGTAATGGATGAAATGGAAGAGAAGSGVAAGSGAAGAAGATSAGVGAVAATGAGAAGAVGAAGAAGATGIVALVAAAPVVATVIAVGAVAAVGLGVAASLGAFHGASSAPPVGAATTVAAPTRVATSPTDQSSTAPTIAPVAPTTAPPTSTTAPSSDPTSPVSLPTLAAPGIVTVPIDAPVSTVAPVVPPVIVPPVLAPPVVPPVPPIAPPVVPPPTDEPTTPAAPPTTPDPGSPSLDATIQADDLVARTQGTITATITNSGTADADDVVLGIYLPADVSLAGASTGSGTGVPILRADLPSNCVAGTDADEPDVSCTVGQVDASGSAMVSIPVVAAKSGTYTFETWLQGKNFLPTPKKQSAPKTVGAYGPQLTVSDVPTTSLENPSAFTASFTVTNTGDTDAGQLTGTTKLPDGYDYLGSTGDLACMPGTDSTGATQVTCTRDALLVDATATVSLQLAVGNDAPVGAGHDVAMTFAADGRGGSSLSVTQRDWLDVAPFWAFSPTASLVCSADNPRTATIDVATPNSTGTAVAMHVVQYGSTWLASDASAPVTVGAGATGSMVLPIDVPTTGDLTAGTVAVRLYRWFAVDGLPGGKGFSQTVSAPIAGSHCDQPVLDATAGTVDADADNPGTLTARVVLTNDGKATSDVAALAVAVPAGLRLVGASSADATWVCDGEHGTVGCTATSLSLAPGASETVSLTMVAEGTGGGTLSVAVTPSGDWAGSGTTLAVPLAKPWRVKAKAAAQCVGEDGPGQGVVTVTLRNRSGADVSATVGGKVVTVPAGGRVKVTVAITQAATEDIADGSVEITVSRTVAGVAYTTDLVAAYAGVPCAVAPQATIAVGQCVFDQATQQSTAVATITLDNKASTVPVTFAVGRASRTVAGGGVATVQKSVGEQAASWTVTAAGQTFVVDAPAVQCVPAFRVGHPYAKGDRVVDGTHVYVSKVGQIGLAAPHTFFGLFVWTRED